MSIRTRCPFLPITSLQEVAKISHPTCTGGLQLLSTSDSWEIRHSDCEPPAMELLKPATLLMSVSYCCRWALTMTYEQLLERWGGMVIRESVSQAERPEFNHVRRQDPLGCDSGADLVLSWPCGDEVSAVMRFFFFFCVTTNVLVLLIHSFRGTGYLSQRIISIAYWYPLCFNGCREEIVPSAMPLRILTEAPLGLLSLLQSGPGAARTLASGPA